MLADGFSYQHLTPVFYPQVRMYETKAPGCPVGSLTFYMSKLAPNQPAIFQANGWTDGTPWYGPDAIHPEDLGRMMQSICGECNL